MFLTAQTSFSTFSSTQPFPQTNLFYYFSQLTVDLSFIFIPKQSRSITPYSTPLTAMREIVRLLMFPYPFDASGVVMFWISWKTPPVLQKSLIAYLFIPTGSPPDWPVRKCNVTTIFSIEHHDGQSTKLWRLVQCYRAIKSVLLSGMSRKLGFPPYIGLTLNWIWCWQLNRQVISGEHGLDGTGL